MRPKKHQATRSGDLFRARLDQIINLKHELAQLAGAIDWDWIDGEIAPLYADKGRPGIETRFAIGLLPAESLRVAHASGALQTRDRRGSRWTPRCSPRTSPSRPTPSCCTPR